MSFVSVKKLDEHAKNGHKIEGEEASKPAPPPKPEVKKAEPIELKYLYTGQCEVCSGAVDTITINVGNKDMMVAYCTACKAQRAEQEVVPIKKQK